MGADHKGLQPAHERALCGQGAPAEQGKEEGHQQSREQQAVDRTPTCGQRRTHDDAIAHGQQPCLPPVPAQRPPRQYAPAKDLILHQGIADATDHPCQQRRDEQVSPGDAKRQAAGAVRIGRPYVQDGQGATEELVGRGRTRRARHPHHDRSNQRADHHQKRIGHQQPRPRPIAPCRSLERRRRCGAQQSVKAEPQASQDIDWIEDEKPGCAPKGGNAAKTQIDRVEKCRQPSSSKEGNHQAPKRDHHQRQGQAMTTHSVRATAKATVPKDDAVPGQGQRQ